MYLKEQISKNSVKRYLSFVFRVGRTVHCRAVLTSENRTDVPGLDSGHAHKLSDSDLEVEQGNSPDDHTDQVRDQERA